MRLPPLQAGRQVAGEHCAAARQLPACSGLIPSPGDVWEKPSFIPLPPEPRPPPPSPCSSSTEETAGARRRARVAIDVEEPNQVVPRVPLRVLRRSAEDGKQGAPIADVFFTEAPPDPQLVSVKFSGHTASPPPSTTSPCSLSSSELFPPSHGSPPLL